MEQAFRAQTVLVILRPGGSRRKAECLRERPEVGATWQMSKFISNSSKSSWVFTMCTVVSKWFVYPIAH